jgi:hypothetical protein
LLAQDICAETLFFEVLRYGTLGSEGLRPRKTDGQRASEENRQDEISGSSFPPEKSGFGRENLGLYILEIVEVMRIRG